MAREEVARLEADVVRAIQSSDLLSLLHGGGSSPQHAYHHDSRSGEGLRQHRHNHHRRKDLSGIPHSVLDECVRPIRRVLETIDAGRLLNLHLIRSREGAAPSAPRVCDNVYCHPIIDEIRPRLDIGGDDDDGYDDSEGFSMNDDDDESSTNNDDSKSSLVRYIHIAEVPDQYTIGIFVFGPHERIPLHDHPEMCVLSRVLYGELRRLSLDLDRGPTTPEQLLLPSNPHLESSSAEASPSWLSRSATWLHHNLSNGGGIYPMTSDDDDDDDECNDLDFDAIDRPRRYYSSDHSIRGGGSARRQRRLPEGTKVAYRNSVDVLAAPGVATLFPYEGNLHEFVAGPHGAAVLDVLLPPYDDEQRRDCTFYNIREIPFTAAAGTASHPWASTASQQQQQYPQLHQHPAPLHRTLDPSMPVAFPSGAARTQPVQQQQSTIRTRRQPCLIIPTGQPENFHCISGRYKDLGGPDPEDSDEF